MDVLLWIIFGLIVGSIANFIAPSSQGGIVSSILLGIVGAIIGGYIGQRFFGTGAIGFNVISFVVAVSGALLVLFVGKLVMRG